MGALIIQIQVDVEILLPRLSFVLDFINGHPLNDGRLRLLTQNTEVDGPSLYYGENRAEHAIFVPAQLLFFTQSGMRSSTSCINAYDFGNSRVYSVEGRERRVANFFDGAAFGFDVFEAIFFHLSRYEECHFDGKEEMKLENLQLKRAGLEQIPVVDHLVVALMSALGVKPEERPTTFILSHDLDIIYKYNRFLDAVKAFAWPIVYRRNFLWGWRNIRGYFKVRKGSMKDPYDSYDFLFRPGRKWIRKVVFFMAGGESAYDLYDQNYARSLPGIWKIAKERGYEIGLHPSYNTAGDAQMMAEEKEQLEQLSGEKIRITRQHFLRYFFNRTSENIESNGFELDSTLGFTRWIGFRSGTGFRHHLYDFEREKAFSFRVLPLVVMDSSLIHQTGDDMEKFRSTLFEFLDLNRMDTQITFNFHNSTFDSTLKKRRNLRSILDDLEAKL